MVGSRKAEGQKGAENKRDPSNKGRVYFWKEARFRGITIEKQRVEVKVKKKKGESVDKITCLANIV